MKKSEQIIHTLGFVKEEYIQQAAPGKSRRRALFAAATAVAACAAVLLAFLWPAAPGVQISSKFPELAFKFGSGGGGFFAYDASEYIAPGPWKEGVELTALPVYKNLWVRNGAGVPPQMADDAEAQLIAKIRRQFGDLGAGSQIQLEDGHGARVVFSEPLPVPEELRQINTCDQAEKMAQFLLETYGTYLGFKNPVADISGGDYNIYGEQSFSICFYEYGDTPSQSVVNFCMRSARFVITEEGILAVDLTLKDTSEEVGSFPVIPVETAQELLYQGYFLTGDSSMTISTEDKIEKVYLTYSAGGREEYYIPYYVFVVATGDEITQTPGLNVYGTYFVPAVPMECIQGLNGFPGAIN